jgi:hypothetical protein
VNELNVIILDITRMYEGRICIAGVFYDPEKGYCEIRPVPKHGNLHSPFLNRGAGGVIEPFTVVRFRFLRTVQCAPHVEDHVFDADDPRSAAIAGKIEGIEKRRLLSSISKQFLSEIYGENLVDNKYIYEGGEGKSLGCMKIYRVSKIYIENKDNKIGIRIGFMYKNEFLSLKLVECRLYNYLAAQLESGADLDELRLRLENNLRRASPVFMRMGLARPHLFEQFHDDRKRCYVQIIGLHTFPDYINPAI